MPYESPDLVEQYLRYTYPYDIGGRLADLQEAVATRRLDGLVHYTQSFCFRQMFDQFLRDHLDVPHPDHRRGPPHPARFPHPHAPGGLCRCPAAVIF